MASRSNPPKKPSGGRPNVRRLFSKDTYTSQRSSESEGSLKQLITDEKVKASKPSIGLGARRHQAPLGVLTERTFVGEEKASKPWVAKETADSPASASTDGQLYDSPMSKTVSLPASDSEPAHGSDSTSAASSAKRSKPTPVYVPPRDEMVSPAPSSTPRARWATIRRAYLPSSTSSVTVGFDITSRVASPTPSFQSFSQLNLPGTRPSTPKPSRLARFGFKHIVAEARDAADDLTRRFAEDIRRACWAARFGDTKPSKPEREASQPILGSALHLPFMSSASLPLANNTSTTNFYGPSSSKQPLRRPPSTMTLSSQASRSLELAGLQAVIIRYASVADNKETTYVFLPHEKEVLSVLLISFLNQSTGRIADEERRLSLEIFETMVKTWRAKHAEAEMERCMWCCRAAIMPPSPLRSRILLNLESLLCSKEPLLTTPIAFRTILPGLAFLIPFYHETYVTGGDSSDLQTVHELIAKVISGNCGRLDLEDLEQKYQALVLKSDSENDLREGICTEGLSRCLELGTREQQCTILEIVEKNWPLPDLTRSTTPLRSKIHLNKIGTFLRSVLKLLHESLSLSSTRPMSSNESGIILRLLTTRIIPEIGTLHVSEGSNTQDARPLAVRTVLALMVTSKKSSEDADFTFSDSMLSEATDLFLHWMHKASSEWQACVENELKCLASSAEWSTVIPIATNIIDVLSMDSRKRAVSLMVPQLQERLVSNPPQKSEALTRLLLLLAQIHPQVFYKPVFMCAASPKESVIVEQFTKLVALAHYMPHFWIADAEMMSVALMSDPGGGTQGIGKGKMKEGQKPSWGQPRVGQVMILLEVISELRALRLARQDANLDTQLPLAKLGSFVSGLEPRLAVLLEAREQVSLLPLSQRMLLAALFLEMRLLSRSLKSAAWVKYFVTWAIHYDSDDSIGLSSRWPRILDENKLEISETFKKVDDLFTLCEQHVRRKTQSHIVVAKGESDPNTIINLLHSRTQSLMHLPKDPLLILFELLVAMSGAIKLDDLTHLCSIVWNEGLESDDSKVVLHACFLCMQCAEKTPKAFIDMLTSHMQSLVAHIRRRAVQKLGILLTWRFQLLSLVYITDRTHRRPFKLARPPISFVATDVGSSDYVPTEDAEDRSANPGQALPMDLRRRLNEIGWTEEDKPVDVQLAWLRTPMSLLGSNQIDALSKTVDIESGYVSEHSPSPAASPNSTPSKSSPSPDGRLARRNSSSGGLHGVKRRPVFVQPLVTIFLQLSTLAMDQNFEVAALARETLIDLMRDDPAILCRPVIDILSEKVADLDVAVTTLRTFLHIQRILPPRLTHHVFNHLAGFLKSLAKESTAPENIRHLAHLTPILAKIAPQVSEMTVQAIRRAKIEIFLFPSGALWFPESAPAGPMFPKAAPKQLNPFQQVHPTLVHMLTIRTSQNLLFVELLKRFPQDVHIVRKNWSRLVLPDIPRENDLISNLPRRPRDRSESTGDDELFRLSLSFARSHLLLVAQMFRCITRHLNDREELAVIFDGVNRILKRHGDDIGVISHCLIVYMIASTRFRRLMSSGGGIKLFFPSLIKVYCEAENDNSIRTAIEYAVHRFYAVHEEVFVFQALDVVSTLVSQPGADGEWIANNAYILLSSLKNRPTQSLDTAGIREANKPQEEETALAIAADEMPQMFLASLRKDSKNSVESLQSSFSADVFDNKHFKPDNLIRMLLTVIAHDPLVRRAEQFLRLFRFLAQLLYNASGAARNVFRDGIEALGSIILTKVAPKMKSSDSRANDNMTQNIGDSTKPSSPCDPQVMVSDYIRLFASYVRAGGEPKISSIHRCLDLVKILLKEDIRTTVATDTIRFFIDKISESFVAQVEPKHPYFLLKEFTPFIRAFGGALDLSGLLRSLVTMISNPIFANDIQFANIVVNQICSSTLEICELAASEGALFALPYRSMLVVLLARSACLLGADIISQIEQREPSPQFLVGIVIPFLFKLRTTTELATETQWTDSWRHDVHSRAWVRLLSYVTSACQVYSARGDLKRSNSSSSAFRSDSGEGDLLRSDSKSSKSKSDNQSQFVLSIRIAVALLALKAVILRGESDISSTFPGAWSRVGSFLRSLLREGNASFAMRPDVDISPNITPLPSPTVRSHSSFFKDNSLLKHKRSSSSTSEAHLSLPSPDGQHSRSLSPGRARRRGPEKRRDGSARVVDYLTWSLLEFICMKSSPLVIQLRTFMHEKTSTLQEELRTQDGSRNSVVLRPKSNLRPLSTMFSKPRYRNSRTGSATPTPEASPRLEPSDSSVFVAGKNLPSLQTFSNWSNVSTDGSFNGPAYPTSPNAPTSGSARIKKRILHLGLQTQLPPSWSSASDLSYASSQEDLRGVDELSNEQQLLAQTFINSRVLIKRTYERVRTVQASMGYSRLLPIPKEMRTSHIGLGLGQGKDVGSDLFTGSSPTPVFSGSISTSASPRTSVAFEDDKEPDLCAWTNRRAQELILQEAEQLLGVLRADSISTPSGSDTGHGTPMPVGNEEGMMPESTFASFERPVESYRSAMSLTSTIKVV